MSADLSKADAILAAFPSWSCWKTATGVCLQLRDGDHVENIDGVNLSDAISQAESVKVLPRIQRRPELFRASDYEPMKRGQKWCPVNKAHGYQLECYVPTKAALLATLAKWEAMSVENIAAYDAMFAKMFPNGATEGVDFRYQR